MKIIEDDLSSAATRGLLLLHLAGMHANSPPGNAFALQLSELTGPALKLWSAWDGARIMGVGALKHLDDDNGEIKSMRTHPSYLRKGVAGAILKHMIGVARLRGYGRLSLETGSGDAFEPALALYRKRGFKNGEAFGGYRASHFNRFLHLDL